MDAFENTLLEERRLITCQPHPQRWEEFSNSYNLDWTAIPFEDGGNSVLPKASGFYCFAVASFFPNLPQVFYPLYAGETDNLYRRYADYLREKDAENGRFHVKKFLRVFDGEAVFVYAPYSADKVALREVEKKLNDALMPPYSLRDFTVEVKQAKAAWQ